MSIIIRLQNLPWAANSLDIRRYFQGLNIPEGGVHIVGGEKGDAFIAFSTDEDARQAMERDGGKIKDIRVKLLLSSRAEMQRVIDQARAQHTSPQSVPVPAKPMREDRRGRTPPERERRVTPDYNRRDRARDRSPRNSRRRRGERSHSRSPSYRGRDRERRDRGRDDRRKSFDDPASRNPESQEAKPRGGAGGPHQNGADAGSSCASASDKSASDLAQQKSAPPIWDAQGAGTMDIKMWAGGNEADKGPASAAFAATVGGPSPLFPIRQGSPRENCSQGDGALGATGMIGNSAAIGGSLMPPALPPGMAMMTGGMQQIPFNGPINMAAGMTGMAGNIAGNMPAGVLSGILANSATLGGIGFGPGVIGGLQQAVLDGMGSSGVVFDKGAGGDGLHKFSDGGDRLSERSRIGDTFHRSHQDGQMSETCCIEIRGLAREPRPRDVKDFFRGLRIQESGIRVLISDGGQKSLAVGFLSKWDARDALKANNQMFGSDRINVLPLPEDIFETAEVLRGFGGGPGPVGNARFIPREEDLIVLMKGLPYSCTEDDVVHFFGGLRILDIFVEHDRNGRATGNGFVEFAQRKDFNTAMGMHRNKIGHRYIELTVGSREMMHAARNADGVRLEGPPPNREERKELLPPPVLGAVPPGHTCISMLGLPDTVTDRDIAVFFNSQGVVPRAIHIMLGSNGVPTGHAFAEFSSHNDCERAFMNNGTTLGPHTISLRTIPYSEVAQALGGGVHPRLNPPEPRGNFFENGPSRGRLDNGPERGRGPDMGRGPEVPPMKRPLLDHALGDMGEEPGRRGSSFPERGGPMRGPGNQRPRFEDDRQLQGPASDHGCPDGFGSPGCVISATNIPYRAGVEDIINFFGGFDVTKENVMRRFNDRGQPTGDARIAFTSARDAQAALAKMNMRPLHGRNIALSIL
ncbi:RNA-binding protein 12-like [Ornithodoros turicata]|uniref:RNA-binding protein 12-like n=1 Tax=Ornithodoros turicata TaxID=34597 RepID=UPI003138B76F